MFDVWDRSYISRLDNRSKLAPSDPAEQVAKNVVEALSRGVLRASVAIDVPETEPIQPLPLDDWGLEWWRGPYLLTPFWWQKRLDQNISWTGSHARVSFENIHVIRAVKGDMLNMQLRGLLQEEPSAVEFKKATIYIEEADAALSRMIEVIEMPPEEWFSRYAKFRNRLLDELVIVAWRCLAIRRPNKGADVNRIIVDNMREYMMAWGVDQENTRGVSDKTLTNMATKIISQWNSANMLEFGLVNSTPDRPIED